MFMQSNFLSLFMGRKYLQVKKTSNQSAPQCLRIHGNSQVSHYTSNCIKSWHQKIQISLIKRYCGKKHVHGSEFFLQNEPLISECIHYRSVSHAVLLHSNQIWHVTELIWKDTNDTEVALDKNQSLKIIQYAIMHQENFFLPFFYLTHSVQRLLYHQNLIIGISIDHIRIALTFSLLFQIYEDLL